MSETLAKNKPGAVSHIQAKSLIRGTMLCTDLALARRMCEELLGLETVRYKPDAILVRTAGHGPGGARADKPYWVLEMRQVDEVAVEQEMLNHWGMELGSAAEVDRAYEVLAANAEKYELGRVQKPRFRNNSYALYFVDKDSNWWELEYRTPDLVYTALRAQGDAVPETND